jgi:hypothetical protein
MIELSDFSILIETIGCCQISIAIQKYDHKKGDWYECLKVALGSKFLPKKIATI